MKIMNAGKEDSIAIIFTYDLTNVNLGLYCFLIFFNCLFYSGSTKVCPSDGAVLTFSDGVILTCPPVELTCSRRTPIFLLTSTTHIPSSCM